MSEKGVIRFEVVSDGTGTGTRVQAVLVPPEHNHSAQPFPPELQRFEVPVTRAAWSGQHGRADELELTVLLAQVELAGGDPLGRRVTITSRGIWADAETRLEGEAGQASGARWEFDVVHPLARAEALQ